MHSKILCEEIRKFKEREMEKNRPENRLSYIFCEMRNNALNRGVLEYKSYSTWDEGYKSILKCKDYLESLGYSVEEGIDFFDKVERKEKKILGFVVRKKIVSRTSLPFVKITFAYCDAVDGESHG